MFFKDYALWRTQSERLMHQRFVNVDSNRECAIGTEIAILGGGGSVVRQLLLATNAHDHGGVDCKTRYVGVTSAYRSCARSPNRDRCGPNPIKFVGCEANHRTCIESAQFYRR
jgi:hypothetical protein